MRPVGDLAFSEGSSFRDILMIAEKKKPKLSDNTKVIFLKKSVREMNSQELKPIFRTIELNQECETSDMAIRSFSYKELKASKANLMRFFSFKKKDLLDLEKKIEDSNLLKNIEESSFPEGFHASPKGLSQIVFITNPITPKRIKRAFLVVKREEKLDIIAEMKGTKMTINIPKKILHPALRSITGIKNIKLKEHDFFIYQKYEDFNVISNISKWNEKIQIDWDKIKKEAEEKSGFLLLPERFNPYSINTHLLAFISEQKIVIPHTIRFGNNLNIQESIIQGLFINSSVFLSQILINREETSGQYLHIMTADLILMKIFDCNNLKDSDKKELIKLYEKIKAIDYPSILEQFERRFKPRIELDKTILKILGFSIKEINDWLPKIYDAIKDELKAMKNI